MSPLLRLNLALGIGLYLSLVTGPAQAAIAPDDLSGVSVPLAALPKPDREIQIKLAPSDFEAPFVWENFPQKDLVLRQAEAHSTDIKAKMAEAIRTKGEEAFLKDVEGDKANWDLKGWGKGEVTRIDGLYHVRVVNEATGVSFYFVDPKEVEPDSKHLRRIVARQHIDAGEKRANGSKKGRDTLIAWTEDHRVTEHHYYPRHPILSGQWLQDYWIATYSNPTVPEHIFGLFCAGLQVGASTCLLGVKKYLNPDEPFDSSVLVMSALWGYGIGAYNSTYRNFIYRGSERSKFIKMWAQSMLFAWSLYIYSHGVWTLINVTAPEFYQVHGNAAINSGAHNQGRRAWYLFPEVRAFYRDAVGTLKLFAMDTGIKRASIEQQMIYLIPYTIKLAGLVGMGTVANLALGGNFSYKLDGGTVALLASVPLAQIGAVTYARSRNYPDCDSYADEFRKYWGRMSGAVNAGIMGLALVNGVAVAPEFPIDSRPTIDYVTDTALELPSTIAGWMARAGTAVIGAAKTCTSLLLGGNKVD